MSTSDLPPIIGQSPVFLDVLEHTSRAADLNKPVLVLGERGTGKELIASRLHFLSSRWQAPLIKVNCAALTESILESELFGHEAGAFTGATRQHIGHFERADGGTLILDELATIPLRTQEKILRTIEYGEVQRVGGNDVLQVDVRIVGSTNANLRQGVRDGAFRADLLDRLAFDVIRVPPLRERREDILELAWNFAVAMCGELGRPFFPGLTDHAIEQVLQYRWPGNVRELKNAVERSIYRQTDPDELLDEIVLDPFGEAPEPAADEPGPEAPSAKSYPLDMKAEVEAFERHLVTGALARSAHNQRAAADLLGLTYDQLRGLVRKFGLTRRRSGSAT